MPAAPLFAFGCDPSPALLGVGYIVGLNIAVLVFAGGCISWMIGIPVYTALFGPPHTSAGDPLRGYEGAITIWHTKIRYSGGRRHVHGRALGLVFLDQAAAERWRSSLAAHRARRADTMRIEDRTERDIPPSFLLWGLILFIVPLGAVYLHVLNPEALGVTPVTFTIMIGMIILLALIGGFLFSAVACYMAGLVGSSNNPVSGVTMATILTTSFILLVVLSGDAGAAQHTVSAAAAAILVGAVVCCAAAISGDQPSRSESGTPVGGHAV